jgi:hypothetical protein
MKDLLSPAVKVNLVAQHVTHIWKSPQLNPGNWYPGFTQSLKVNFTVVPREQSPFHFPLPVFPIQHHYSHIHSMNSIQYSNTDQLCVAILRRTPPPKSPMW